MLLVDRKVVSLMEDGANELFAFGIFACSVVVTACVCCVFID